jgi:hypothetical protein
MTTTLLAPSMRLANEAIAKRIVAKVRDHSPALARHLSTGFLRTRLRRWPGITNLQVLCHDCNRRVPGRLNRT